MVARRAAAELDRRRLIGLMLGEDAAEADGATERGRGRPAASAVEGLERAGPRCGASRSRPSGGEIVGLAGQVGSGASEVLRALAGLVPDARGRSTLNGRPCGSARPIGARAPASLFASNDRKGEGLFLDQSVEAQPRRAPASSARAGSACSRRRAAARAARHSPSSSARRAGGCDAGRRPQRRQPAEGLPRPLPRARDAELLLLDEPTRGVDVGGRAEIHQLIRQRPAAGAVVIFASTELDEILDLADVVVTMFAGRSSSRCPRGGERAS